MLPPPLPEWYQIFEQANAVRVGAYGFVIGVLGLSCTVAGFIITWLQLRRTKKAANAVATSLNSLKLRVNHFDKTIESTRVLNTLASLISSIGNRDWDSASRQSWDAQVSLAKLRFISEQDSLSNQTIERSEKLLEQHIEQFDVMKKEPLGDHDCGPMKRDIRDIARFLEISILKSQKEIYDQSK